MISSLRNIAATTTIGVYLISGLLVETTHHEHFLPVDGKETISKHDCADKEIHVPLGSVHLCPACIYSGNRLFTVSPSFTGGTPHLPANGSTLELVEIPAGVFLDLPASRGPPLA